MMRRRRRALGLLVALVLVVLVGVVAYLFASGRAVVPTLSGRLYPIHYQDAIARVSDRYDLDPYLVAAIVHTESNYNPKAVSHAGAVGLMQLMPDTAAWVVQLDRWKGSEKPSLTDPDDNLELGACYLAYLLERFGGSTRAAVAAYNAGPGAVDGWLADSNADKLYLDDIPFDETRDFVIKVERYRALYLKVHPDLFAWIDGAA
jgi:soluble lytic murein transglycosylase